MLMHRLAGLIALLVGLIILTPFVYASTFEAWPDGIFDAESDDVDWAAKSSECATESAPLRVAGSVAHVAHFVPTADDSTAPTAIRPASRTRAPPAS